jgi:hypothetical protein
MGAPWAEPGREVEHLDSQDLDRWPLAVILEQGRGGAPFNGVAARTEKTANHAALMVMIPD